MSVRGAAVGNLTPEQVTKLDILMAELETLPTPELIAESGRLRCPLPLDDAGRARVRLAIGGGIAAQKLLSYIEALRDVDDRRGNVGRDIYRLRQEERQLRAAQSLEAANPALMASHLAGRQEAMFHFFVVSVGRIERLLPIAAKAAGHKLRKADRDLLGTYRPLRDYYEHLEDRLPGGTKYAEAVTESERAGEWRIQMGFSVDNQQRIVIGNQAIDVTPRGVAAVEEVLQRNWEQLRVSALATVRKHFEADPFGIPGPEEVKQTLLVSTGAAPSQ